MKKLALFLTVSFFFPMWMIMSCSPTTSSSENSLSELHREKGGATTESIMNGEKIRHDNMSHETHAQREEDEFVDRSSEDNENSKEEKLPRETVFDGSTTDKIFESMPIEQEMLSEPSPELAPIDRTPKPHDPYDGTDIKGIEQIILHAKQAKEQWRKNADQRIDKYRKATFSLTLLNRNNQPIPHAKIHVQLTRHAFPFGGAINARAFIGQFKSIDPNKYKTLILKFFNKVGFNNALKYKLTGHNYSHIPPIFKWLKQHNIPVRGHTLIWPGGSHLPRQLQIMIYGKIVSSPGAKVKNLTAVEKQKIRQYCENMIKTWAAKWDVTDWDVINESRGNHVLQDILGKDVMVDWFKLAQKYQVNKNGGLYLNENRVISAPPRVASRFMQHYINEVTFLLSKKAPITGFGFQSRYKFKIDPDELYRRLEKMAKFKLPMSATEMEITPSGSFQPDETVRAQMTEMIMRLYFSHPLVHQIIHWSFFSYVPKNPNGNSALVWPDGSLKLNGKIWLWLTKQHWNTNVHMLTNSSGKISLRAFLGQYKVTITAQGHSKVITTSLPHSGLNLKIKF